ncbi:hypothetical protein H5410_058422 [Solanum commersonii]|uniref:Uncharacterized protein n=1 Tax=Solanum commersonii TaxID=4109 RepID=A0A9J5WTG9_SOLCO|nr:hypothetical protein H5410_058422 [Solanum commersonii]
MTSPMNILAKEIILVGSKLWCKCICYCFLTYILSTSSFKCHDRTFSVMWNAGLLTCRTKFPENYVPLMFGACSVYVPLMLGALPLLRL